jgi:cell division septation protein DedD
MKRGNHMAVGRTAKKKTTGKTAAKKKVARKPAPKKTVAKKAAMKEGSRYVCRVCGLGVTIDTACGCVETAHLICCEKPMKAAGK